MITAMIKLCSLIPITGNFRAVLNQIKGKFIEEDINSVFIKNFTFTAKLSGIT